MTRRDYVLIAAALKEAYERRIGDADGASIAYACMRIAAALKRDNPRFDVDHFYKAIGLVGPNVKASGG